MLTNKQEQELNWEKNNGVIPAIIQHAISGEVIMLGYMNNIAIEVSKKHGYVTFLSRSKKRLWTKGETSGNKLKLINIYKDCDNDTLLILAIPNGPICHKGTQNCFSSIKNDWSFIYYLEQIIKERKKYNKDTSYTAKLFSHGTKRIAQKIGEEGIEVALAAVTKNKNELINETADLLYHLLVLLEDKSLNFNKIVYRLRKRHLSSK